MGPVSFCAFGLPGTLLALGDMSVSRLSGGFEKLARKLAPALLERGGRLPYSELFDLVEEIGREVFSPSGTNAAQFIRDAEHSGFLAPADDEHAYSMPIPSFARHLLGDG